MQNSYIPINFRVRTFGQIPSTIQFTTEQHQPKAANLDHPLRRTQLRCCSVQYTLVTGLLVQPSYQLSFEGAQLCAFIRCNIQPRILPGNQYDR